MGNGGYDVVSRSARAVKSGYYGQSVHEVTSSSLNDELNPELIKRREARDNIDHPKTLPVMLAIDVTGSMGDIPQELIRDGLPHIIGTLQKAGINDVCLCICAFGDAHDYAPLQISQFEANDELLDKWLTSIWLESHGCGNQGEDPSSVWWFAANKVDTDAWEKRKEKGIIITISDELCHRTFDPRDGKFKDYSKSAFDSLNQAREKWDVFHIHTHNAVTQGGINIASDWKEMLGEDFVFEQHNVKKIPQTIADIIMEETVRRTPKTASETHFIEIDELESMNAPINTKPIRL